MVNMRYARIYTEYQFTRIVGGMLHAPHPFRQGILRCDSGEAKVRKLVMFTHRVRASLARNGIVFASCECNYVLKLAR